MTSASDQAAAAEYPAKAPEQVAVSAAEAAPTKNQATPPERGGRIGPDPTRYGDWEKNGRCIDF